MIIMLLTRCGCTRWMEIPDKIPPPYYYIAMHRNAYRFADVDTLESSDPNIRIFRFMDQSRYGNFAVYLEE